ncbi:unnamed protein product [Linum tenue]|uniref:Non-specific lipid-transfer protein n=1 Tax=Linum tenue TaxID=586396 RepID=A0AAV0JIH7_9ROSI|nr:unnamed protein product [Linum tenue]
MSILCYPAAVVVAAVVILAASGTGVMGADEPAPPLPCSTVYDELQACIPYLSGRGDPSKECCGGVKAMQPYSNAKSSRSAICQCLKSMASLVPGVDLSAASKLPKKCNVNVKLPELSLDIDCSKA